MRYLHCLGIQGQVGSLCPSPGGSHQTQGRPGPPLSCSSVCMLVPVWQALRTVSATPSPGALPGLHLQVPRGGWRIEAPRASPPKSLGPARHDAHCHFLPSVPSDGNRASNEEWLLSEPACAATVPRTALGAAGQAAPQLSGSVCPQLAQTLALRQASREGGGEGNREPETPSSHRQGPELPIWWDEPSNP